MYCFNVIVHNVVRINILLLLLLLVPHSTVGDINIINRFELTQPFGFDAQISWFLKDFGAMDFFLIALYLFIQYCNFYTNS